MHYFSQSHPAPSQIGKMPGKGVEVAAGDVHAEEDGDHVTDVIQLPCVVIVHLVEN